MNDLETCVCCGRVAPSGNNYCSWDCEVEEARSRGGKVVAPNGLPIKCIRWDGAMLECEHGDHPDYKFPITVDGDEHPDDVVREFPPVYPETHALIYTDGNIAITLHECGYYMWHLSDGRGIGGSHQQPSERLSDESLSEIRGRFPRAVEE